MLLVRWKNRLSASLFHASGDLRDLQRRPKGLQRLRAAGFRRALKTLSRLEDCEFSAWGEWEKPTTCRGLDRSSSAMRGSGICTRERRIKRRLRGDLKKRNK